MMRKAPNEIGTAPVQFAPSTPLSTKFVDVPVRVDVWAMEREGMSRPVESTRPLPQYHPMQRHIRTRERRHPAQRRAIADRDRY